MGVLTPDEIDNLSAQIKSNKESLTSMSQLDMVQLQSLTGKYEQTNSLASQVLKQQYGQAQGNHKEYLMAQEQDTGPGHRPGQGP